MTERGESATIAHRLSPREKDIGDFSVRRVLPAATCRAVGAFVFFDHMGPASFPPGKGIAVRPHPHIGLATVTYLFEGEIIHRDSLGFVQPIRAGAVNLMTAGRGIVHSERAGDDLHTTSTLHGIQSWMALSDGLEDIDPAFLHIPADALPDFDHGGVRVRVIIGEAFGHESPVPVHSAMLYLECRMPAGSGIELPFVTGHDLAVYVVAGSVDIDQQSLPAGVMAVARPDCSLRLTAQTDSRVMVIGGEPVGERMLWWNFVASSRERIDAASQAWGDGLFDTVPGDTEFIPLPDRKPASG